MIAFSILIAYTIPFDVTAPVDPFYSKTNLAQIEKAIGQVEAGKVVTKTMEELEPPHQRD